MNALRHIFREQATSILFVLGLTISCFILINVAELSEKIGKENQVLYGFSYTASSHLDGCELFGGDIDEGLKRKKEVFKELESALTEETKGNTYLELQLRINEQIDTYAANLVMKLNEDPMLHCISDYDVTTENGIIIGETLVPYVTENDGIKTIGVGGKRMRVIGILENEMSGGVDNSIYLFWENCDKQVKENLKEIIIEDMELLDFSYKSQTDIAESYQNFVGKMEGLGYMNVMLEAAFEGDYQNYWYRMYNSIFMGISLIFSLFNCFSVSYLWLLRRKTELAIRKAYGYSIARLTKLIFSDILKLCIPAGILSVLLQCFYTMAFDEDVLCGQVLLKILFVCTSMIVIAFLNALNLLGQVKRLSPVTVLAEN